MRTVVVDASVIIKWIFPEKKEEEHLPQALHLLHAIRQAKVKVLQPAHWLAECIAVIVRLKPQIANEVIDLLDAMNFSTLDTPEVYRLASQLAEQYRHHLFDTLYHAVALENGYGTQFITADKLYYKKSSKKGSIIYLGDFSIFAD